MMFCCKNDHAILWRILAGALLACTAHATTPTGLPPEKRHNVLIINSYNPGYKWSDRIMEGMRSVLGDERRFELYIEYMDSKRHEDEQNIQILKQSYLHHYSRLKPDIILSSDDNAFDFLVAHREELFPGVPVIFCGVNDFQDERLNGQSNFTGVAEDFDFKGSLELALLLQPGLRRVVLVGDETRTSQINFSRIRRILPEYESQLTFDSFTQLSEQELRDALRDLPSDSAVFVISFFRDREGKPISLEQSLDLIAGASPVPVYSCWDSFIQRGVVGGRVVSGFLQGKKAGEMALRILEGEPAGQIPILRDSPNQLMVDYPALARHGLPAKNLPRDTLVLNKPFSFYERYYLWIWGAALLLLVETVLIVILLISRHLRKTALRALRREQALLSNILSNIPSNVFWKDTQLMYRGCNEAFARLAGMETPAGILGKTDYELAWTHEQAESFRKTDLDIIQSRRPLLNHEARLRCADGTERTVLASKVPLYDDAGRVLGILGIDTDISGLKKAEEDQRMLADIMEASPAMITIHDFDGQMIYANQQALNNHGYTREEILRMNIRQLDTPEQALYVGERVARLRKCGDISFETAHRTKDGSEIPLLVRARISRWGDQDVVLSVGADITDRKKAEQALRESEERFRTLAEDVPSVAVQGYDRARRVIFWNQASENLYGYARTEALGRLYEELLGAKDNQAAMAAEMNAVFQDGKLHPPGEMELRNRDGHSVYVYSTQTLVRNIRGEPEVYRVDVDLSERRRAETERRLLEAQIQQTQKLESLGVLAGGIAHDFNNLLMGILGNADLAGETITPASPGYENILGIKTSAKRAADLCRQLLAYSGKGRFMIEPISLTEIVQEMAQLLEISISKTVVLKRHFAPQLPAMMGDPTQIRQIAMNLITNASEAIGEKSGVISLVTGAVECSKKDLQQTWLNEPLQEGLYVFLEVSDTGCGMDDKHLKRIFDPFFTSKFTGRGLGLAAVLGIVRGHKGAIQVQSKPGKGSCFRVLFPAAGIPARSQMESASKARTWKGQGTFLLVDDEETVRAVGKLMLSRLGYHVLTASDGREALTLFEARRKEIAGVLLDLTMPHMNGEETFVALKAIAPEAKVILSSGYTEQEISQRFADKGIAGFIQKPYQLETLAAILQKIMT